MVGTMALAMMGCGAVMETCGNPGIVFATATAFGAVWWQWLTLSGGIGLPSPRHHAGLPAQQAYERKRCGMYAVSGLVIIGSAVAQHHHHHRAFDGTGANQLQTTADGKTVSEAADFWPRYSLLSCLCWWCLGTTDSKKVPGNFAGLCIGLLS